MTASGRLKAATLSILSRRAEGTLAMLLRPFTPCSVAAAASLVLSSVAASAAPAAAHTAPLKIDFSLTPAQIDASCKSEIDAAGKRVDAMLHARSRRTFKTVAEPLENIISDLGDNLAAQTFLFNVAPDKAVRDASERCNTAVSGYQAELFARPDLYAALDAAAKSHTAVGTAQKKLLDIHLVNARRSGAGLPPEQRKRFVELAKEIADLENTFAENLSADTSS